MSSALTAAITRVGKALRLEQAQGCRDRATSGGIARFAGEGLAPLRGKLPTRDADDRLDRVDALLHDYRVLAAPARQERLTAALAELRDLYRLVARLEENDPTSQPRYIGPRKRGTRNAEWDSTPRRCLLRGAVVRRSLIRNPQSTIRNPPSPSYAASVTTRRGCSARWASAR